MRTCGVTGNDEEIVAGYLAILSAVALMAVLPGAL